MNCLLLIYNVEMRGAQSNILTIRKTQLTPYSPYYNL